MTQHQEEEDNEDQARGFIGRWQAWPDGRGRVVDDNETEQPMDLEFWVHVALR